MTAGIAELVGRSGASLIAFTFWQLYGNLSGILVGGMGAGGNTSSIIMYFEIMKGKKTEI